MPSLDTYKRAMSSKGSTVGQYRKQMSDIIMEATWDNDISSRICYIYDFYHDDEPGKLSGMTYDNTTKTKIDLKFIATDSGSISKDYPQAKIMFKPSQKTEFQVDDELYYIQERKEMYGADDPFIGLYVDIPNDKGVYHRWMICAEDISGNQFKKYLVLECNYRFQWISRDNNQRIKNQMWCVLRSQSSYNSGLWTDSTLTTRENQEICFIPTNQISDTIWYVSEDNKDNQRIIVDEPNYSNNIWTPNTWQVSKIERVNVRLRTKITLYQTEYNKDNDYIEHDVNGKIIGMWADYFTNDVEPIDFIPSPITPTTYSISSPYSTIKVGGSYRLLSIDTLPETSVTWSATIEGEDASTKIKWLEQTDASKIKIKVLKDESLIGKTLVVSTNVGGELKLQLISI